MKITFKAEKDKICELLNYPDYDSAIQGLYKSSKSTARTGRVFDVTKACIIKRLHRSGYPMQNRGGYHPKPKGKFRFDDELDKFCWNCLVKKQFELPNGEVIHFCPWDFEKNNVIIKDINL